MVMKKTYAEIAEMWRRDFSRDGMTTQQICDFLGEHDYGIIHKGIRYAHGRYFGREELHKPFAPVHILSLRAFFDDPWHVVVMDSNGTFFCPSGNSHEAVSQVYYFDEIIGIYPPRNR